MNDQKPFERFLSERFDEFGPGRPMSDETREDLRLQAYETRQRPRWLALIEERPMRTDSHLAVGSPTARVMAIVVATVLLLALVAGAGIAGSRLLASDGAIVVAQDGSGEFTSIGDAVEAAGDGDTILVRPGTYAERIDVVGKDLTIRGDGDRAGIIVEAVLSSSPLPAWGRYPAEMGVAIRLQATDSVLSNLTIVNTLAGIAITVTGEGATAMLDGLDIRLTAPWDDLSLPQAIHSPVTWDVGTAGTLRDSTVEGLVHVAMGSDVILEGNRMNDACVMVHGPDAGVTLRDNVVTSCPYEFVVRVSGHAIIEGNDLSIVDSDLGIGSTGRGSVIIVDSYPNAGNVTLVRDNDIHDGVTGVEVFPDREAEILGNRLSELETGVAVSASETRVSDNTVTGNSTGVFVPERAPTLEGNIIEGNGVGLRVGLARPVLIDNRICDNEVNLQLTGSTQPETGGNEICPDEAA